MSNNKKNDSNFEFYSHLIINKTKRAGFLMLFFTIYGLMTFAVFRNLIGNHPWTVLAVPAILLGLCLIFFPPFENWVYNPWQAKPQKYERHYRD